MCTAGFAGWTKQDGVGAVSIKAESYRPHPFIQGLVVWWSVRAGCSLGFGVISLKKSWTVDGRMTVENSFRPHSCIEDKKHTSHIYIYNIYICRLKRCSSSIWMAVRMSTLTVLSSEHGGMCALRLSYGPWKLTITTKTLISKHMSLLDTEQDIINSNVVRRIGLKVDAMYKGKHLWRKVGCRKTSGLHKFYTRLQTENLKVRRYTTTTTASIAQLLNEALHYKPLGALSVRA